MPVTESTFGEVSRLAFVVFLAVRVEFAVFVAPALRTQCVRKLNNEVVRNKH